MYCPGCGYDLRGLSSDRCPECGLTIDTVHSGIIPWERRKEIGYFKSFFRTLVLATFHPTQLARATGAPIDVRSATLFRWIVRLLATAPCILLFVLGAASSGGLSAMITIEPPTPGGLDPSWEPRFLWTAGAVFWPTLPVAFALSCILATGTAPWFFMKRLELVRRSRAMAFSFYLCAPLGWIPIPGLAFAAVMILSDQRLVRWSHAIGNVAVICGLIGGINVLLIILAILKSFQAIDAATQCGFLRSIVTAAGVIAQAFVSCVIGLALFPMIAGLLRLMIWSLRR
jgi:hypothetical protein